MSTTRVQRACAFTILELVVVVVIVALVSVTALPAFGQVRLCRQVSARSEIVSLLRSARAHAMAMGDPSGLGIDPGEGSCQLLTVPPGGSARAMLDPLGSESAPVLLGAVYPGASVESVTLLDGSSGAGVIWFSNTGGPEVRDDEGTYVGAATEDAEIAMEGASPVAVDHLTGRIR